jgi:hypothetical protein
MDKQNLKDKTKQENPIDFKETSHIMNALATVISEGLPGVGFALLMFNFGNPELANYVSNAEREVMIKALREVANHLEQRKDIPMLIGEA